MLTFLKQSVTDMIWVIIWVIITFWVIICLRKLKFILLQSIICEARIYRVLTNSIQSKVLLEAKQTGGGKHLPLFISHLL